MRGIFSAILRGRRLAEPAAMVAIFLLGLSLPLAAQGDSWQHKQGPRAWTPLDTLQAWAGYNQDFYAAGAAGGSIFAVQQGGSSFCRSCWWEEVEEIEVAEDAYDWAKTHDPTHLQSYSDEVEALCTGFNANMYPGFKGPNGPYDWSGDNFNDDLNWGTMAFSRAYRITHDTNWLAAAQLNFNTVWNRAQAPGGLGNGLSGLMQTQPHGSHWTANLDSPVNFTFVIAGYLIYDITHDASYKTKADNVYQWAIANLYTTTVNNGVCNDHPDLTCAKIYDGTKGHSDYAYNYGIAIQAAARERDFVKAQYIANWLMFNSNNPNYPYVGSSNGYNILPNYHQGGKNDDGYNGIALRGVGYAIRHGVLHGLVLAWAQANVAAAWATRNSDDVMWNNWTPDNPNADTPASGLYSWDCSSAMAGMFDIPATRGASTLTSQTQ